MPDCVCCNKNFSLEKSPLFLNGGKCHLCTILLIVVTGTRELRDFSGMSKLVTNHGSEIIAWCLNEGTASCRLEGLVLEIIACVEYRENVSDLYRENPRTAYWLEKLRDFYIPRADGV